MEDEQINQKEKDLICAFEAMWGKYPEPVRLINNKFMIVGVNEAYKNLGGTTGVRCNTLLTPEFHKGCKAMKSLKTQETQTIVSKDDKSEWTTYWIPVQGYPEYFIHFTNGLSSYLESMKK